MTHRQTDGSYSLLSRTSRIASTVRNLGLSVALLALSGCITPPPTLSRPVEPVPIAVDSPTLPAVESIAPANAAVQPSDSVAKPNPLISEDNNVFFASGSTTLDEKEKEKLQLYANRLKQNPKTYVTLSGHTDDVGSRNYNLAIAEERLMTVNKLLQSYGVLHRQIRRNRSGSAKTSPTCTTTECRRQSRRVELIYAP